jgi:hypothetical protein
MVNFIFRLSGFDRVIFLPYIDVPGCRMIEVKALARQTVERSGKVTLVDSLQKTVLPQSSAGGWKKDNFSLISTMR